jgi:hypothetical protein
MVSKHQYSSAGGTEFDSSSEKAIAKATTWIEECDRLHDCRSYGCQLPNRVLDIGEVLGADDGDVKLVESNDIVGVFAALSHSWGKSPRVKTTWSTLAQHLKSIKFSSLPETFRDACFLCRKLKIRYLCIDTLCIIQGDDADWIYEASRMDGVYKDAYISICASTSSDDSSSLFPNRKLQRCVSKNPDTKVAHVYIEGLDSTVYEIEVSQRWLPTSTRSQPKFSTPHLLERSQDPLSDQSLNLRAWTLQERWLSSRRLHYSSD